VVPLVDVIQHLKPILQRTFGEQFGDDDSEAFVASFIAGLFLTHRRIASISQEGEELSMIMIEDMWPHITSFDEVLDQIEHVMQQDSEGLEEESTGSENRMNAIAERARVAEEKAARRQARLEAKTEKKQPEVPDEFLGEHDWLVE
jgi:hypothetical protein